MKSRNRKSLRSDVGQGMTEYIIVVALVAIGAIGVVTTFGGNLRSLFATATSATAGDTNAVSHAQEPSSATTQPITLANFGVQQR